MTTLSIFNQIVSVEEMIRNYRFIFDKVKSTGKPIIVLRRNRPDVALINIDWLEQTERKLKQFEEENMIKIVNEGRKEWKKGKVKVMKSISTLMKNEY